MVTRSLFTGVSGLQSHFDKMDTLSNNISNLNTPGFKKSNVVFKSFISQQTATASAPAEDGSRGGTNPQSVGLGVTTGSVNLDMSQGQLQRTGVNTDLAIQGEGFFTTREAGSNRNIYTRAGSFQFDEDGNLVDPANGNVVQGFTAETENGEIKELVSQGQPDDVQVTQEMETIPAQATTFQNIAGNLDASSQKAIDPVTVDYGDGSSIEYQFERVHPEENYFKFNATWQGNPPSGKQIGSPVEDKITGENIEGVVELNDQGQVIGTFENPDNSGNVGAAQVEAAEGNQGDYSLRSEEITVRDQQDFLDDIPEATGEMRILIGDEGENPGGPDASGGTNQFIVQWQNEDGEWKDFNLESGEHDEGTGNSFGTVGNDFTLTRETSGTNERTGELEIDSEFWGSVSNAGAGDAIFFETQQSDDTGVLNKTGEELKEEFRWGGPNGGSFRASTPETTTGSGNLNGVFNYDEANLGQVNSEASNIVNAPAGTNPSLDDLENKEFIVRGNNDGTQGTFRVFADVNNDGDIDLSDGSADELVNQNGTAVMSPDEDNRLVNPGTSDELGVSIASEDWENLMGDADDEIVQFKLTQSRSPDSGRPFMVAQDGSSTDNTTAIFGPGGTESNPSSITFTPNSGDSSGILNNTSGTFANLQRDSASGGTTEKRADATVQTVASSDVFDSRGEEHTLNYTFEKKNENEWLWHVQNPQPQNPDEPKMAGFGTVTFDENGQQADAQTFTPKTADTRPPAGPQNDLDGQSGVYFDPPETLEPPQTGASPVEIDPDFSNISQFGGNSNLEIADQDGTSQGTLSSLSFDQTGTLQGSYDNGERRELAQLSIANFQNPEGLTKEGGTYFGESANSGIAQPGTAGSGGRGTVTPGALERSNVELSAQFTRVISTQRGFQANNRTITTTDEMVQSVLQLI